MSRVIGTILFVIIPVVSFGQSNYGYGEGVIVKKDSTEIKCFVEMNVTYGNKVSYALTRDGKELQLKSSEIKSILTPANYYENIILGKIERLMALVTDGKVKLFRFVKINSGAPSAPGGGNVSLYGDPTLLYALKTENAFFEINSKNFKSVLTNQLQDQTSSLEEIQGKRFKFSDVEKTVTEYNRLQSLKRQITARVVDAETKKPVKDAKVRIARTNNETTTNLLGFAQITIDAIDTLIVDHPDYLPFLFKVPAQDKFQIILTRPPPKD